VEQIRLARRSSQQVFDVGGVLGKGLTISLLKADPVKPMMRAASDRPEKPAGRIAKVQ
jgi:hypothetical protein